MAVTVKTRNVVHVEDCECYLNGDRPVLVEPCYTPDRAFKAVTWNTDAKTRKGVKLGWMTGIHYGAPAEESGVMNTCPDSTPGCRTSCLFTAGRAEFDPKIASARIFRTVMFVTAKPAFWTQTIKDILALKRAAARRGLRPCVRMNGTTDIPWERVRIKGTGTDYDGLTLMEAFKDVQFYDYTKTISRLDNTPDNYYLLASYSEAMNLATLWQLTDAGHNVAVVFRVCDHQGTCGCPLPPSWSNVAGVNGDKADIRFEDPAGVIVGLKAKGRARDDVAGFVVDMRGWWK